MQPTSCIFSTFIVKWKQKRVALIKSLPIGIDNFKDIIEQNCYYVDKTKLIEALLDKQAYVTRLYIDKSKYKKEQGN